MLRKHLAELADLHPRDDRITGEVVVRSAGNQHQSRVVARHEAQIGRGWVATRHC
jgi:hypothetical protein